MMPIKKSTIFAFFIVIIASFQNQNVLQASSQKNINK